MKQEILKKSQFEITVTFKIGHFFKYFIKKKSISIFKFQCLQVFNAIQS